MSLQVGPEPKCVTVGVLLPGGPVVSMQVEVEGVDLPTIHHVLHMAASTGQIQGWTPKGQWIQFNCHNVAAIFEEASSRAAPQAKRQGSILMPNTIGQG